ncbi:hypothetical protein [Haloechinothrix alba]|nr:hypothetical protein [Haloechinothrix alba]
MHEAGQDSPGTAPGLSLAAWFQVGVDTVPPADRPLPVHPFLCCIRDVMSRLGTLRLQALQVLLPMQYLGGSTRKPALVPSLPTADWFATCDHVSRTPIRITLDSGQDRGIPSAAPEMHSWMLRWDQDTFTCESYSVTGHDPLAESFPYGDGVWPGPPLNRATFRGTLAEWSLDALGWLGGFLAEASTRHAITTPVLLTVSRADEAASG